jgi:hypothetical protein
MVAEAQISISDLKGASILLAAREEPLRQLGPKPKLLCMALMKAIEEAQTRPLPVEERSSIGS